MDGSPACRTACWISLDFQGQTGPTGRRSRLWRRHADHKAHLGFTFNSTGLTTSVQAQKKVCWRLEGMHLIVWNDHAIWGNSQFRDAALDLIYAAIFRQRPKKDTENPDQPLFAIVRSAIWEARGVWKKGTFLDDPTDETFDSKRYPDDLTKPYVDAIRRLLYGEQESIRNIKERGLEGLDALLFYALKQSVDEKTKLKYNRILLRCDLWKLIEHFRTPLYYESIKAAISSGNIKMHERHVVLELLEKYFSVSEDDAISASGIVTKHSGKLGNVASDSDRGYYYCYRYADKAGSITKTFQVFTPPDTEYPYLRFQNFHANRHGSARIADGAVMMINGYLFCLGRVGSPGTAIKILVLQKDPDSEGRFTGMALTTNGKGDRVLAARVLMKPAMPGIDHHTKTITGNILVSSLTIGDAPPPIRTDARWRSTRMAPTESRWRCAMVPIRSSTAR